MNWHFYRRVRVLPWVTLNLSRGGASVSLGPPGLHLTVGAHGARVSAGLPGSGLWVDQRLGGRR